jgi:hypothetical protein
MAIRINFHHKDTKARRKAFLNPNPDKPEKKTFNHDGNNGALPCKKNRTGGKPNPNKPEPKKSNHGDTENTKF